MPTLPAAASRVRDALSRRSPAVLALGCLLAGAALCLGVGVAFPLSDHAPIGLGWALMGAASAMAAFTLAFGERLPGAVLLGEACVAATLNSVIVAASHTGAGAMVDGMAYGWLMVYVAVFFPAAAGPFAGLVAAGFGAGLLASGLPGMAPEWGIVSLSTLMVAVVLRHLSRVVRRHLTTDPLTGALNREGLRSQTEGALRGRRRADVVTVALLDLDGFKLVNDEQGHAAGDRLLAEAARAWRRALRGEDVLARTGGDEFVVIMPGTTPAEAAVVLERLRGAHPVAWSAGVSSWRPGEPLEDCLERADRRLYAEKAAPCSVA